MSSHFMVCNDLSLQRSHQAKESVAVPVVANGDIRNEEDVARVHQRTGVNGNLL